MGLSIHARTPRHRPYDVWAREDWLPTGSSANTIFTLSTIGLMPRHISFARRRSSLLVRTVFFAEVASVSISFIDTSDTSDVSRFNEPVTIPKLRRLGSNPANLIILLLMCFPLLLPRSPNGVSFSKLSHLAKFIKFAVRCPNF